MLIPNFLISMFAHSNGLKVTRKEFSQTLPKSLKSASFSCFALKSQQKLPDSCDACAFCKSANSMNIYIRSIRNIQNIFNFMNITNIMKLRTF